MNLKSIFLCPACGRNLRLEVETNFLYCGHGPCKVSEMNEGAKGNEEQDAYNKLVQTLENLTEAGKYEMPFDGWHYNKKGTLPYLRPTGIALLPAPKAFNPSSPNWENSDMAKLAQPTFEEMTGSD